MSRYIDADALIKHLDDEIYEFEELREQFQSTVHGTMMGLEMVKSYAKTLSTADVVEVVRCKDCAHWGGVTYGFVCRKFSGIDTKICMGADRYCSYGERKEK